MTELWWNHTFFSVVSSLCLLSLVCAAITSSAVQVSLQSFVLLRPAFRTFVCHFSFFCTVVAAVLTSILKHEDCSLASISWHLSPAICQGRNGLSLKAAAKLKVTVFRLVISEVLKCQPFWFPFHYLPRLPSRPAPCWALFCNRIPVARMMCWSVG